MNTLIRLKKRFKIDNRNRVLDILYIKIVISYFDAPNFELEIFTQANKIKRLFELKEAKRSELVLISA